MRPLSLQPYVSYISKEISLVSKFTVLNLIQNLSCINTESVTVPALQNFLVNSQTIIKRWYFHMGIFIHSLDMLENTYIQSFNHLEQS